MEIYDNSFLPYLYTNSIILGKGVSTYYFIFKNIRCVSFNVIFVMTTSNALSSFVSLYCLS